MKQSILIRGPFFTQSGYGSHSRDIIKSLIKLNEKYNIYCMECNWGNTPPIKPTDPFRELIKPYILGPEHNLMVQPDFCINIDIPDKTFFHGKKNILISALVETTLISPQWFEFLNGYDLVIVPSEFNKKILLDNKYEAVNKNTNQVMQEIKFEKEVEVLFEGLDIDIYKKKDPEVGDINTDSIDYKLFNIPEKFCFLVCGHWLSGVLGHDRKDIGMSIKVFLETFKNIPNPPALVLKVSKGNFSLSDKEEIKEMIDNVRKTVKGELPNIYLIFGDLTDEEMNDLYNHSKIKALINFTKGESWGRPILEFSVTGKPIIASNYSGYLDFLKPEFNTLLEGRLTPIHPSALMQGILIEKSSWFTVNYISAGKVIKNVFENYNSYLEGAKRQAYRSRTEFSLDKMTFKLGEILEKYSPPKMREIVLPKLKRPTPILHKEENLEIKNS
jgi:glycosyltransferase involved in cell wall biosynthesis